MIATIQQTGNKQSAVVCITHYNAWSLCWRNNAKRIAALFFRYRRGLPNFSFGWRLGNFCRWTTLRHIGIVRSTATRAASLALSAPTAATDDITDIENRSIGAIHRERIAIAIGDWACRIHSLHPQNIADGA